MKGAPKILINAKDGPTVPSGYGMILKHLAPRLAARYGPENILLYAPVYTRDEVREYEGMRVLPGLSWDFGEEFLHEHWKREKPTFLLQIGDWFPLQTIPTLAANNQILWVQWAPADWLRVPQEIIDNILRFAWRVVPWTAYGQAQLQGYKLRNVTAPIPLGVDTSLWRPCDGRELPQVMKSLGFQEDSFNVLYLGAAQRRKYAQEQIEGLGLFRKTHPDIPVRLYVHTLVAGEVDMQQIVQFAGLADVTVYPDQFVMHSGGLTEEQLVKVFNCADVVLSAAFEGMGLALLQAQSIGCPVIGLAEGPADEIVQFGALCPVGFYDYTQPMTKPVASPVGIASCLEQIYNLKREAGGPPRSIVAREKTKAKYDWDVVASQWFDLVDELVEEIDRYSLIPPERPAGPLVRRAQQTIEVTPRLKRRQEIVLP